MEEAILGGATMVQLREKTLTDSQLLRSAQELKDITDRHGIPLIINDRPDIALKCGADGVHIGQGDGSVQEVRRMLGPDKIIGISAHNPEEAAAAEASGADYLGIGAVFSTSTKKDTVSISSDELRRICSSVSIPTVAIGGITDGNIPLLRNTGIDGVAVVSAIFSAEDPRSAAKNSQNPSALRISGSPFRTPSADLPSKGRSLTWTVQFWILCRCGAVSVPGFCRKTASLRRKISTVR